MTNFGTSGTCLQYGDDDTFWRITALNDSIGEYKVETDCDAGCQTCDSTFEQNSHTCYSKDESSYIFYSQPEEYGIFCQSNDDDRKDTDLTYLLFLLFVPFLFCVSALICKWCFKIQERRQRRWVQINDTPSTPVFEQNRTRTLINWMQETKFYIKCCFWDVLDKFELQKQYFDMLFLLLFIAFLSEMLYLAAWIESPPFELYESFNSTDISLPSGMIDSSNLKSAFDIWETFAKVTTYFGVGGIALCMFIRVFIKTDEGFKMNMGIWHLISILILRFAIMIIPNLTFIIHKLIRIYPGYSKFLDDNQDIKSVLESLVGFIITGLGFGYLACW
jgi:hypothetical protein